MMYVLILGFISAHIIVDYVDCGSYAEYLKDSLPQLCPYSNFCNQKAAKRMPRRPPSSPCCKFCSCDATCISTGNCCPDYSKLDTSSAAKRVAVCMPQTHSVLEMENALIHLDGLNLGLNFYHTYNNCPAEYTDEDTRDKCLNPDPTKYNELVTVSDKKGRVFKNRNCATCHGISKVTTWDMNLMCSTQSIDRTFANLPFNRTHLKEPCTLFSSPPESHVGMSSRCFRSSHNTCNETGLWAVFDKNIKKACESPSTSFYYIAYQFFPTIYKNPHCFLCNNRPHSELDMRCPPDDNNLRTVYSHAFSALLDITALGKRNQNTSPQSQATCDSSKIYDPYFDTCRLLNCPVGSLAMDGSCILPYKQMYRLTIEFPIALNISIPDQLAGSDHNADSKPTKPFDFVQNPEMALKAVVGDLLKATGLESMGCLVCETLVYEIDTNQTGDYMMLIKLQTYNTCMVSDIIRAFKIFANGYSDRVSIGERYINVSMINVYGLSSTTGLSAKPYINMIQITHDVTCTARILISEKKFYCPSVDLKYGDYSQIVEGNVTAARVSLQDFSIIQVPDQSDDDGNGYRICVGDYLIPKRNNVGALQVSVIMSVFIVIILLNGEQF